MSGIVAARTGGSCFALFDDVAKRNAAPAGHYADIGRGLEDLFFKAAADLKPIATPPFHAVEIRPAIVCLTSTGVRIDPSTQALDTLDRSIPGLYAAGETTGSVLGERYIGGGNPIAIAIVFGRIAGREAARAVLNR